MVLGVDDWIETQAGDIGLVTDVSKVKRSGGEVAVYFPDAAEVREIPTGCVRRKFLRVLVWKASS